VPAPDENAFAWCQSTELADLLMTKAKPLTVCTSTRGLRQNVLTAPAVRVLIAAERAICAKPSPERVWLARLLVAPLRGGYKYVCKEAWRLQAFCKLWRFSGRNKTILSGNFRALIRPDGALKARAVLCPGGST